MTKKQISDQQMKMLGFKDDLKDKAKLIQSGLNAFDLGSYDWNKSVERLNEIRVAMDSIGKTFMALENLNELN